MVASGNSFFFPWEVNLMEWLQSHISGAGMSFISLFSMFGEELLLILILGFVYWSFDKKLGRTVGLSAIMGLVWNTMAKNIVLRRRPYFDHESIRILRPVEPGADIYDVAAQGYSFPSGHSTNATTMFGSLAVNLRRRWVTVIAIIIAALTGLSRIVVGAHYPTDVLAGWLLGAFSILIVQLLQKRIRKTLALYGILDYLFGGWFLNALQFIFDYPLAFAMLGLAGLFRNTPNKKAGLVLGTFVGSLGRYIAAVLAGVFFWADGRTGLEAWTYSFAYNGSYMAIECVLCIVIAVLIGERILKSINRYK